MTLSAAQAYVESTARQAVEAEAVESTARQAMAAQAIAALAVTPLPPDQWAGWVCYLLEALDGEADEEAFRDCLESVRDSITVRLEAGRW